MFKKKKKEEAPEIEKNVPMIYSKSEKERIKEAVEEKKAPATENVTERIQVVKELPTIPVREYRDEKGVLVHLKTVEESLTEIMNDYEEQ